MTKSSIPIKRMMENDTIPIDKFDDDLVDEGSETNAPPKKQKKTNNGAVIAHKRKTVNPKVCMDLDVVYPPFKEEWLQNQMAVIYVDVPWTYRPCGKLGGLARDQYPCLTAEQLKLLKDPIQKMAAKDCALLFWTTGPKMMESKELIEEWGFDYKTVFTVWEKLATTGNTSVGLGFYTRSCYEFLLLATKGNMKKKVKDKSVLQKYAHAKSDHSSKPKSIIKDVIERVFDLERDKKIELFARSKSEGWEVWGNDPKLFYANQEDNEVFDD